MFKFKNSDGLKKEIFLLSQVIFAGILLGTNTKIFAKMAGLYPGGATGLSILIQQLIFKFLHISITYTPINVILNAIPIFIGYRYIGKKFTNRSLVMIIVSSIATDYIPIEPITHNILLASIFGGILNGLSVSMALRAESTSGGTDFIAIFMSEKKGVDTFNIILGFNIVMLCTAGYFFGYDKALYSIIFQYCSTEVLHRMYKNYMKQTLLIISDKTEEICEAIYDVTQHGATILDSIGSYEHVERKLIYSVISRADTNKVMKVIKEIDNKAFVNAIPTTSLTGRFVYRPYD